MSDLTNQLNINPNTPKEGTMTTPTTISIGGIDYVRADLQPLGPTEWRIVVAQRGWVFVGRWEQDGDNVTLHEAKCIRVWGTTKGLGELAASGPTAKTVLDPCGTVRLHTLGVVVTLDTKVTAW